MTKICSEKDMVALETMFIEGRGRGVELSKPNSAAMRRAMKAGLIKKVTSEFFCEKSGGNLVVFTENGRKAMLRRLCARHPMDIDDALHLVRTGSFDLVSLSTLPRSAPEETATQMEAF
jgi:hypothetical protein